MVSDFFWSHFENKSTAPVFDTCARLLNEGPVALIDDTAFVCSYGDQAERSFGYRSSEPGDPPELQRELRQLMLASWH